MMENFGEKTPNQIKQVIVQCFDLMDKLKQNNRDKKSREWFEKLKLSKEKIVNSCSLTTRSSVGWQNTNLLI